MSHDLLVQMAYWTGCPTGTSQFYGLHPCLSFYTETVEPLILKGLKSFDRKEEANVYLYKNSPC